MDFKQLESFVTIAKYNSFSKASRDLYLTQPTLSNHIQNLEKELGTPLFDRRGKTIELTPAGIIFRNHAIDLIKGRDTALFRINALIGHFGGTLELPCSTVPGETVVPDMITAFVGKFPGIQIKLHNLDSQDVIDAILEKKYSMGFVGSKPNNDFESIKIYCDDMVFIGPFKTPLDNDTVTVEEILNLPMIVREEGSGSGSLLSKELKKNNLTYDALSIVAISESFHVTKKLVSGGAGYALVPRSFAQTLTKKDSIKIYELENMDSQRTFYFITLKKSPLTSLESQFKEFISHNYKID